MKQPNRITLYSLNRFYALLAKNLLWDISSQLFLNLAVTDMINDSFSNSNHEKYIYQFFGD
jgi:hypothetical protein